MSVTVVGSIAFDRVDTPWGNRERMLGGAATHFALAASFFDPVRVVGPVGDDFGDDEMAVLRTRGTNTDDVERVAGGKTFFWHGEYGYEPNARETHHTQLVVFEHFEPSLDAARRTTRSTQSPGTPSHRSPPRAARPSSSSWPTSSLTSSAACASSARTRA